MKRTKDFFFFFLLLLPPCVSLSLSLFLFLLLFRSLIDGLAAQRTIKAPEIKRQHERERKKSSATASAASRQSSPTNPFLPNSSFFRHLSFNFQFASVSFLRFGEKNDRVREMASVVHRVAVDVVSRDQAADSSSSGSTNAIGPLAERLGPELTSR